MSKPLNEQQIAQVQAIISECGFSQLLSVIASDCDTRKGGAADAGLSLRARHFERLSIQLDDMADMFRKL